MSQFQFIFCVQECVYISVFLILTTPPPQKKSSPPKKEEQLLLCPI